MVVQEDSCLVFSVINIHVFKLQIQMYLCPSIKTALISMGLKLCTVVFYVSMFLTRKWTYTALLKIKDLFGQ